MESSATVVIVQAADIGARRKRLAARAQHFDINAAGSAARLVIQLRHSAKDGKPVSKLCTRCVCARLVQFENALATKTVVMEGHRFWAKAMDKHDTSVGLCCAWQPSDGAGGKSTSGPLVWHPSIKGASSYAAWRGLSCVAVRAKRVTASRQVQHSNKPLQMLMQTFEKDPSARSCSNDAGRSAKSPREVGPGA
eukprot:676781-Amphidinium_carterae.2